MKKVLLTALSCALCLCLIQPKDVHSLDFDKIYEDEIKCSILDGVGTYTPYS